MRKIFIFILVCFSAVIILDRMIAFTLDSIFEDTYSGSDSKINYILNTKKNDVLFIGSSRVNHNIDPKQISPNSFNLGIDGRSIAYCAGAINMLHAKNKMSDTILLHISLSRICDTEDQVYDGRDIMYFSKYYNDNKKIKSYINNLSKFESFKYLFNSFKYNGQIFYTIKNRLRSKSIKKAYNSKGFSPISKKESDKKNLLYQMEQINSRPSKGSCSMSPIAKQYLIDIMNICKENKTKLIFFTSPSYSVRGDRQSAILKEFRTLTGHYPYLDFGDTSYNLNLIDNLEFWQSPTHLNSDGALVFSKFLKQEVKKIK